MNETATLGERMARIEGVIEHLATKADVAAIEATIGTAAWGLGAVLVAGSLVLAGLQVYFGLKNRPT